MDATPEELRDAGRRLNAVHPMQVERVLDHPEAAAQFAQNLRREAVAHIHELLARLHGFFGTERTVQRFGERRALIALPLARPWCGWRSAQLAAPRRREGR